MPKIVVLCPSVRPEGLKRLRERLEYYAVGNDWELFAATDADLPSECFPFDIGYTFNWMCSQKLLSSTADIFWAMNDDCYVEEGVWDQELLTLPQGYCGRPGGNWC